MPRCARARPRAHHEKSNQLRPSSWYGRSVWPALKGGLASSLTKLVRGGRTPDAASLRSRAVGVCGRRAGRREAHTPVACEGARAACHPHALPTTNGGSLGRSVCGGGRMRAAPKRCTHARSSAACGLREVKRRGCGNESSWEKRRRIDCASKDRTA
eukprot:3454046-Prymnesium_polylepis.1